jgi:hypothetical protein
MMARAKRLSGPIIATPARLRALLSGRDRPAQPKGFLAKKKAYLHLKIRRRASAFWGDGPASRIAPQNISIFHR